MSTTYKRRKIVIGLFGFGTVGKGLWEVLNTTPALHASIKKICIKNGHKEREAPQLLFTTSAEEILKDGEINVVVELIDDAQAAFEIVKLALENGKDVVSANKKMIAENFETLVDLQRKFGGSLLYEGACCASIPVIRNLEEYYDNDMLTSIEGIINGSTNYILSSLAGSNISFREALLEAQQLGYAESNPVLDIEGHDAANKLSLLIAHGFGKIQPPGELLYAGINNIRATDTKLAKEKGLSIKLVATAKKLKQGNLAAFVLPQFVGKDNELFHVHDVYNGLVTESSFADKHFFKGKGAGAFPTAAAVLSDISALQY
ncbi:MAG: homoserine dehydrogenase, partial [Ferruginibacter sp.]